MKKSILLLASFFTSAAAFAQVTITNVIVSASTSKTATIQWTTSGPSTSQIRYGYDVSLPYSNNATPALVTSHSMTLTVLNADRPYDFAVVSVDGAGHVTQSPTATFALCGQPFNPVTGTVNNYYEYGSFTLNWVPPAGAVATPTVCGQAMNTTITGILSGGATLSASVADAYKVVPGPGAWNISVTDAGNLAPITVTVPLSAQNTEVSQPLQVAASTAGLVSVLADAISHAVFPSFICTTFNSLCSGSAGGVVEIIPSASVTCTPLISGNCVGNVTLTASGGVSEIIPGANANCTPLVSGHCVGNVTIAASPATLPGTPQGSVQYANFGATAFMAAPPLDTDVFNTSNNGATQAQLLGCVGSVCDLFTPANSTDVEPSYALPMATGKISSMWIDHRGNRDGEYFTNPQRSINFPDFGTSQSARPGSLMYTEPNPGTVMGAQQGNRNQISYYMAPGYSNGNSTCPGLFCPPSPYTGAAQWSIVNEYSDQVTINGSGIGDFRATICNFSGTGDHQCGLGGVFVNYAGGFYAPSDEGSYPAGSVQAYTTGDYGGTLTTVVDANHIKVNSTTNSGFQGQGRFILDFTNLPKDQSGTSLGTTLPIDLINNPGVVFPYGTVVVNSRNLVVSTAIGTLTNDCTVPIQTGGVAIGQNSLVNGCDITVTSGAFTAGGGPVCMAANSGNLFDIGVQVISVTAPGGHQTLQGSMHRSVSAGGYVFQGGGCGTGILADWKPGQAQNGTTVFGSLFPIIGTPDAHHMAYVNYNASQVWSGIPNPGSQFGSRDTGNSPGHMGFSFPTLTRTSGLVTGLTSTGGNSNPPTWQMLNTAKFFSVSGCTDSTMNSTGVGSIMGMPGPEPNRVSYALAGPDNVCTNAVIAMQNTTVSPVFIAEIYDVANHTPGLTQDHVVDGTMAISYQPNFQVTDVMDSPTHYAGASTGLKISSALAQPLHIATGLLLDQENVSSYDGEAIHITTSAPTNETWGTGGVGYPLTALHVSGYIGDVINLDSAPAPTASLMSVGFPIGNLSGASTNSTFRNYNVWSLNVASGRVAKDSLNFDSDTDTYCYRFGFSTQCLYTQSATGSIQIVPAQFSQAQFDLQLSTGFTPQTQVTECSPILANGASPLCYNPVITNNAVITQSGTAGTTQYQYVLGVTDVAGLDFSKIIFTFTGNATLSGTNFNSIPCTDLPAGHTGEIYILINPSMYPVGACSSSATVVHDTGVYGSVKGHNPMIDGGIFDSGGFRVQGLTGFYSFSRADNFGTGVNAFDITASINQIAEGVLSLNTTTRGDHAGELLLQALGSGTASNTDLTGELSFTAATTATYTFTRTYTSHPECWAKEQATTATSGASYITYTGVTSFTINFPAAFTGNVSYGCNARN